MSIKILRKYLIVCFEWRGTVKISVFMAIIYKQLCILNTFVKKDCLFLCITFNTKWKNTMTLTLIPSMSEAMLPFKNFTWNIQYQYVKSKLFQI